MDAREIIDHLGSLDVGDPADREDLDSIAYAALDALPFSSLYSILCEIYPDCRFVTYVKKQRRHPHRVEQRKPDESGR